MKLKDLLLTVKGIKVFNEINVKGDFGEHIDRKHNVETEDARQKFGECEIIELEFENLGQYFAHEFSKVNPTKLAQEDFVPTSTILTIKLTDLK